MPPSIALSVPLYHRAQVGKLQLASVRDPVRVSTRKSKFQAVSGLRQYVQLVSHKQLDTYLVYFLRVALGQETAQTEALEPIRLQSSSSAHTDDAR